MPTPTGLFYANPSDDQSTFIQKFNYNMDLIWTLNGGPQGLDGLPGGQGVPGPAGLLGPVGPAGANGTYWYVQNTDPISFGTISPEPLNGTMWLDTTAQTIWQYNATTNTWTQVASLVTSGEFRHVTSNPDHVIFSQSIAQKKLVLSPLDYEANNALIQDGQYKLKIIGNPGDPVLRYGVTVANTTENPTVTQSYVQVNEIIAGTEYTHETVNPTGDMFMSTPGTTFAIKKANTSANVYSSAYNTTQISSSLSSFLFNPDAVRITHDSSNRHITFFNTPSTFALHFGGHVVENTPDTSTRFLSIFDNKTVSVGDIIGNPVTGDTGMRRFEVLGDVIGNTAGNEQRIARFRVNATPASQVYTALTLRAIRNFADSSVTSYKATELRLEGRLDDAANHFIAFGQGAQDNAGLVNPLIRFGYGSAANDGYYQANDSTGHIVMASSSNIKTWLGANTTSNYPLAKLTIEPAQDGAWSNTGMSSVHLTRRTGSASGSLFGVSAGSGPAIAYAQYAFEMANAFGTAYNMHMGTGSATTAMKPMKSIYYTGPQRWWSYSDSTQFMQLDPGVQYITSNNLLGTSYFNELMRINSFNTNSLAKSIVFQDFATDTTGAGDGFFGIGEQFSEAWSLEASGGSQGSFAGETYKTIVGVANGQAQSKPAGIFFKATTDTLFGTATTVALGKPQTKFHVYGSITFGTRTRFDPAVTNHSTEVGALSFVHGEKGRAAGAYSVIIAGGTDNVVPTTPNTAQGKAFGASGHNLQSNATGSVIIGWKDQNYTHDVARRTILAQPTLVAAGPFGLVTPKWETSTKNGLTVNPVLANLFVTGRQEDDTICTPFAIEFLANSGTTINRAFQVTYNNAGSLLDAMIMDNDSTLFIQSQTTIPAAGISSNPAYAGALYDSDPFLVSALSTASVNDLVWLPMKSALVVGNNRDTTKGAGITLTVPPAVSGGLGGKDPLKYVRIATTSRNTGFGGTVASKANGIILQPGHHRNNVASNSSNSFGADLFISGGTSSKLSQPEFPGIVYLGAGVQNNGTTFQEISPIAIGYKGSQETRVIKGRIQFTQTSNIANGAAVDPLNAASLYTVNSVAQKLGSGPTAKAYLMTVNFTNPLTPENLGPNGTTHITATTSVNNNLWMQESGIWYSYPVVIMNSTTNGFDIMLLSGSSGSFPSYTPMDIFIDFTVTAWYKI